MTPKTRNTPPTRRTAREYLRVSVDRSGREKSNDEQHADNVDAAPALGIDSFGKPYRDTGSASKHATKGRDDFDRLLTDLAAGRLLAESTTPQARSTTKDTTDLDDRRVYVRTFSGTDLHWYVRTFSGTDLHWAGARAPARGGWITYPHHLDTGGHCGPSPARRFGPLSSSLVTPTHPGRTNDTPFARQGDRATAHPLSS